VTVIAAWASVLSSEDVQIGLLIRDDELADHRECFLRLVPKDAVARVGEDLESRADDRVGHVFVVGEGCDRVQIAGQDQRRRLDPAEFGNQS